MFVNLEGACIALASSSHMAFELRAPAFTLEHIPIRTHTLKFEARANNKEEGKGPNEGPILGTVHSQLCPVE